MTGIRKQTCEADTDDGRVSEDMIGHELLSGRIGLGQLLSRQDTFENGPSALTNVRRAIQFAVMRFLAVGNCPREPIT